jgi:hypothetical protein
MANSELYCNDPGTTLSAAITSTTATSLAVTSGTGYPSSGNFRIKIDSELMLVTAISGTTWTVTRGIEGTTAATHANLAPVNAYFTAGGFDAIRTNISGAGTFAKLPTSAKQGDRYKANDASPYEFFYNGATWDAYAFGWKCTMPPASTWKGTGAVHTYTGLGGVLRLVLDGGTTQGDGFYHPSSGNLPGSGNFRARMFYRSSHHPAAGDARIGIYLYDSTSAKAVVLWHNAFNNPELHFEYWTNITTPTFSSTKYTSNGQAVQSPYLHGPTWIGLGFHGGSIFVTQSADGVIWPAGNAFTQTDFLPNRPTHLGIYMGDHTGLLTGLEVLSLEIETGTTPTNYWEPFS